jgi:hypothetical protein
MTPSGIEPATFRLVTQCLDQVRHQQRVPYIRELRLIDCRELYLSETAINKNGGLLMSCQNLFKC